MGFFGERKHFCAAKILFAKLNSADPPFEGFFDYGEEIAPPRLIAVGYEVNVEIRCRHVSN